MDITTYALLLKKLKSKANLVDGKIPSSELPSYVDDVIEYESISNFPQEGEEGKIYVALDTGYTYRWSGSQYIQIGGQDLSLILNNFADFYDEQSTYEENDLIIYEETLYKCNQDISVAESFDNSHWDVVTVEELLDEKQDVLPTVINDRYLHTNSSTGVLEWVQLSIPTVVQDLTSITAGTLDSTAWNNLKTNHSYTITTPTMTGLDSTYDFVDIKLSINSNNQFVKLSKDTTDKYSGLFFIEESTNLYEITVYYNGTNIILRCATVY